MDAEQLAAAVQETKDLALLGWLLVSAALVFFMQAGFALVESGAVRHKNSVNVALKNVIDLCASFPAFFIIGYSLMFGPSLGGLIGQPELFLRSLDHQSILNNPQSLGFFLFQVTFCSTAATIVSGGVAERCRFLPYLLVSIGVGVLLYPIYGHWVWGGGWLSGMGFHDFAGSSVVHMLGGGVTLAGVIILGPRIGRFDIDGKPRRIPASSMPMVAVGCCLLAFGWVGFNGGSAPLGEKTPLIIVNTLNAACFGGLAALLAVWAVGGLASVDVILNGFLGGLVAITANCDIVSLPASALIGMFGGLTVAIVTQLLEKLRLDDAVGAVPVHLGAGAVGIICTALFAQEDWLASQHMSRMQFLGVQCGGALVCAAWSILGGMLLWWIVGRITTLRIGAAEEAVGMNFSEHKVDDPVLDLTLAVTAASAGKERQLSLDNVRDGDLVPLAKSVSDLIHQRMRGRQEAGRVAEGMSELSEQLRERGEAGQRSAGAARTGITETRQSLDRIAGFLASQTGPQPSWHPIVVDLVRQLLARMQDIEARVSPEEQPWPSIGIAAEQIDEFVAQLRKVMR